MSKLKNSKETTKKADKSNVKSKLNKEVNFEDLKNIQLSHGKKQSSLKLKDMNFLDRYEIVVENKPPKVDPKFYLIPLIVVVAVILVVIIIMQTTLLVTTKTNKTKNEYINSEDNIAKYSQAVKLGDEISKRRESKNAIENTLITIKEYPNLDKALVDSIFGTAASKNVVVDSLKYDSQHGYLSLSCNAKDCTSFRKFVYALNKTNKFELVSYDGFSGSADDGYTSSVSCICKGN